MSDRKNFLIGVLTLSAAILTLGHLELSSPARANVSVIEGDFQLITARTNKGDDGLYVLDRRKNLVAFFSWDPAKKTIAPRDVKSLDAMMGGG